jgi:NAD(P)-dependent dehydrogenase (short-subunit alcohol dehydrogenase family)
MMLMKSIAQEFAPHRIRVNSIAPGAIRTPDQRRGLEAKEAYDALIGWYPTAASVSWMTSPRQPFGLPPIRPTTWLAPRCWSMAA